MSLLLQEKIRIILVAVVVLAPIIVALAPLAFGRKLKPLCIATVIGSFLTLLASFLLALGGAEKPLQFYFLFNFYIDDLSIFFILLVNLVALFASLYTHNFLSYDSRHNPHHNPAYFHIFFNFFHLTMLIVPMVDNLILLWIAVELTTVVSTLLVRYRGDRPALEAAWKFIIITTTGIIFALLGTLFLTSAITEQTQEILISLPIKAVDPMRWSILAREAIAKTLDPQFIRLSFLFVLIGYGTKAGLAPMHTWLPDGHGEAPSPVSALLSGVMLKSALYAILRFYTITNLSETANGRSNAYTSNLLLIAGVLSLFLATLFILKPNRFKRVLAYHSLEHMGIITLGIGVGTPIALFAALLHALNHALTKALMFLAFGYIQNEYGDRLPQREETLQSGERIQGVLSAMPITGIILLSGGLALVGSPPFNIFMSEFMILWAATQKLKDTNQVVMYAAVIIFLLTITIIFGGLVNHISRLLLDRPPFPPIEPRLSSLVNIAPFALLLALILLFGFVIPQFPVNFPQLLTRSAEIIVNGVVSP